MKRHTDYKFDETFYFYFRTPPLPTKAREPENIEIRPAIGRKRKISSSDDDDDLAYLDGFELEIDAKRLIKHSII